MFKSKNFMNGVFNVVCRDYRGRLRWIADAHNGVTSVGLDCLLNSTFLGVAQITQWYVGLINNAGFSNLGSGDTAVTHGGWTEIPGTALATATRPIWTPDPPGFPTPNQIVNSSFNPCIYIMNAPATIYGVFLCSSATIGGTGGVLYSTAGFVLGARAVSYYDSLTITYTLIAANNPSNI